jgi:hypothetical protein
MDEPKKVKTTYNLEQRKYKRYMVMQCTIVNRLDVKHRAKPSKDSKLHEIIFHPHLEIKYLRRKGYELRLWPRLAGSRKNRLHTISWTEALHVSFVGAWNAHRVVSHGSAPYQNLYLDSQRNGSSKWFYFWENRFSREFEFKMFSWDLDPHQTDPISSPWPYHHYQ